jgi:hypothetical protein
MSASMRVLVLFSLGERAKSLGSSQLAIGSAAAVVLFSTALGGAADRVQNHVISFRADWHLRGTLAPQDPQREAPRRATRSLKSDLA